MDYRVSAQRRSATFLTASCAVLALSACGGGSGGDVISTPVTPATPSSPITPPSTNFLTEEYYRSDGPEYHDALEAWKAGASGQGVTLAIVDTGIDRNNAEFAGRISPASKDTIESRNTIQAVDDHGTQVALVAAAARNNVGVMGIAYNATIQVLRADRVGSCTNAVTLGSGCKFNDADIAEGVIAAADAGARVVNLSLGGSEPGSVLTDAIDYAVRKDVVVVVAAGNDGEQNPDPFASGIRSAGGNNVIIAGSVSESGTISKFSNLAGSDAAYYLSARGQNICCVYEGSDLKITTEPDGSRVFTVVNGTSFAAPQISGAVALLAQAFPSLTNTQIVSLLLQSAREAGAAGTDTTYGRGILDIGAAFKPQGQTSLAGTTQAVSLSGVGGTTSPAMGDALQTASLGAVILDGYSRAYSLELAQNLRMAGIERRLSRGLASRIRNTGFSAGTTSLAFNIDARAPKANWVQPLRLSAEDAEQSRVLSALVTSRLSPGKSFGFAYRQSAQGLAASLQGKQQPAFLVAPSPDSDIGPSAAASAAFGYRQLIGKTGLTITAESGSTQFAEEANPLTAQRLPYSGKTTRIGVALDRQFGALGAALSLNWLREQQTVLGARFDKLLGTSGANSLFADLRGDWEFSPSWTLGLSGSIGQTKAQGSGIAIDGAQLISSAWAVDVQKSGVFGRHDAIAFRLSQPLRVESCGLTFGLPVAYDYATGAATFGQRTLSLIPHGRELISELAWRGQVANGNLSASIFWRKEPGHYSSAPDDKGIALRFSSEF